MMLTILIKCFNEKSTILKVIEHAKEINLDKEIIIIDNGSTDGTGELLKELKHDKTLEVIIHAKNMGVGFSGIEGISVAKGDYIYNPGADLEYKMEDVYKMVEKLESRNLDAVLGSRLLERSSTSRYRLVKERPYWLGTIIATFLINLLFRKNFSDIIGTNLIRTNVLKSLSIQSHSQTFTFELVSKLCKKKYKVEEISVSYEPRSHREGKTIRVTDMIPALFTIFKVRFFN